MAKPLEASPQIGRERGEGDTPPAAPLKSAETIEAPVTPSTSASRVGLNDEWAKVTSEHDECELDSMMKG
eukprot:7348260-Pyramimonas_sp.AAC.1